MLIVRTPVRISFGGGGTDLPSFYCREDGVAEVREALRSIGLHQLTFKFDFHGSRVILDDPFFDSQGRGGITWRFTSC